MTAKEKGIEIFHKHWDEGLSDRQAKECALISVDEIIKTKNGAEKSLCTFIAVAFYYKFWHLFGALFTLEQLGFTSRSW